MGRPSSYMSILHADGECPKKSNRLSDQEGGRGGHEECHSGGGGFRVHIFGHHAGSAGKKQLHAGMKGFQEDLKKVGL